MIFSLLAQVSKRTVIIIQWSLNQNYIAQTLCENKAKPALKCNGKCHLKKELLKEDTKTNSNNTHTVPPFNDEVAINKVEFQMLICLGQWKQRNLDRKPTSSTADKYALLLNDSIWHPPCDKV